MADYDSAALGHLAISGMNAFYVTGADAGESQRADNNGKSQTSFNLLHCLHHILGQELSIVAFIPL